MSHKVYKNCPRCGNVVEVREACDNCGLLPAEARFQAEKPAQPKPVNTGRDPDFDAFREARLPPPPVAAAKEDGGFFGEDDFDNQKLPASYGGWAPPDMGPANPQRIKISLPDFPPVRKPPPLPAQGRGAPPGDLSEEDTGLEIAFYNSDGDTALDLPPVQRSAPEASAASPDADTSMEVPAIDVDFDEDMGSARVLSEARVPTAAETTSLQIPVSLLDAPLDRDVGSDETGWDLPQVRPRHDPLEGPRRPAS